MCLPEFALGGGATGFLTRQSPVAGFSQESDQDTPTGAWPPCGVSWRTGGVTTGDKTARWSPLALWIAEQIKQGVRPVPLPPLPELLESVFRNKQVDYRFGHIAQVFSGPSESHPTMTAELRWQDALNLLNRLTEA